MKFFHKIHTGTDLTVSGILDPGIITCSCIALFYLQDQLIFCDFFQQIFNGDLTFHCALIAGKRNFSILNQSASVQTAHFKGHTVNIFAIRINAKRQLMVIRKGRDGITHGNR